MANHGGSSPLDIHCVLVETNLETRLVLLAHKDENISDFKEKLCKEHNKCFPEVGEINISALKVKRRREFFHLPDSMNMIGKAFESIKRDWFLYVDAVRVDKGEPQLAIMDVDQNCTNPELVDKKKEIAVDSIGLVEGLKTEVKKTRKRKTESSGGTKSRKKSSVDINRSALAMPALGNVVDESKMQVEVGAPESCAVLPRGKPDDIPVGAMEKDIESGEKNGIDMEENQQTSEVNRLREVKVITVNSMLIDGQTRGEIKDVEVNQTLQATLDGIISGTIEQDHEKGEGRRSTPNLQTAEVVTHPENHLEASSNLTTGPPTEKKKKQKKTSKDHVSQSAVAATSALKDIVNVDSLSRETLGNPPVEAIQKEKEMDEKSVKDVGIDKIETENLKTHLANHLDTNSGLTTTEKKKRGKKISKDHINQSCVAATSTEILNEINGVPGNVDGGDATPNAFPISECGNIGHPFAEAKQKETEMDQKRADDVGAGKAILSVADSIRTNEADSGLTTGPATEKKKKQKKSSKDRISQSTATTTILRDHVDATSESFLQVENEMGDKVINKLGPTNNLQVADLVSTPVQESKTLDRVGKSSDDNRTHEDEAAKDNATIDAGDAKSAKSIKKKIPRKAKTAAKEDTLVASGAKNEEPIIKVVDGGEPDNVIRNVLDSLQQNNKTAENLGKTVKKSSKKSRKKDSVDIVEAHVLSVEVNNNAVNEVSLISNPKATDLSFTPAKNDTESHLKKSVGNDDMVENADMVDNFGSSQKDTVGGGGKKQDQGTGGIKSKKQKKSLDLLPGGSVDGSLSSMKPKERKGRLQPASSGTSHSQSKVKNDQNRSKVDRSNVSVKGVVTNKKEAMKETSNSVTLNKCSMNFFKDAESDSTEDESKKTASDVSTKSPSDSSSDDDSDVTSMKQGNILPGGRFSGGLKEIFRSSKSFKMAKLRASQSQTDMSEDENPALEFVPDSQAN